MELAHLTGAVRADRAGALIALDFDGTLAPIVTDPNESRPLPGTVAALRTLAGQGCHIAIVTGRDAATVVRLGGLDAVPDLVVAGLYGAERWHDGRVRTMPTPATLVAARERLPPLLTGADPALWIEDKRLSLVVHARRATDPEAALDPLRAPIAELAGELGLQTHSGRAVLEVRLPGFDKATALRQLVAEITARVVVVAGDDVGDLPALREVRALRALGITAFGVAVGSAEVPSLAEAADIVVAGPAGVLDLLRRCAE